MWLVALAERFSFLFQSFSLHHPPDHPHSPCSPGRGENQNRPKSSQSFREIAHKLQTEVFAWRLSAVSFLGPGVAIVVAETSLEERASNPAMLGLSKAWGVPWHLRRQRISVSTMHCSWNQSRCRARPGHRVLQLAEACGSLRWRALVQCTARHRRPQEAGFVILRQSAAWKLLQHVKLQGPKTMLGVHWVTRFSYRFAQGEQSCVFSAATLRCRSSADAEGRSGFHHCEPGMASCEIATVKMQKRPSCEKQESIEDFARVMTTLRAVREGEAPCMLQFAEAQIARYSCRVAFTTAAEHVTCATEVLKWW